MVLHCGVGPIRSTTYLPSVVEHLHWGRLPGADDAPVLTIDPGTDVTIDTLSHEGLLEDQGRDPQAFFGSRGADEVLDDAIALAAASMQRSLTDDGPHVTTGPIAVRGARPGDLLAMTVIEALPRVPYGVVSNRHQRGALPEEYPLDGLPVFSVFATLDDEHTASMPFTDDASDSRRVRFPTAPFLGIMGVAAPERLHSVPPGAHGGNIDLKLLTAGSTLYLPVQVPEALAYVGDPHFAQGDGEVALTAMEASLRVTVRFDLIRADEAKDRFGHLTGPLAETAELWLPTGMDLDLDVAVQHAVRSAIALLQAHYGMDARHAYAYLSAAADVNITQVVDIVKGAHVRIRKADFA